MNQLNFSVIIATHKRPVLLRRAISSLQDQGNAQIQVVVVSDTNDAATYEVAAQMLRAGDVFSQCEGLVGPAESRNLALSYAKGDYILFLDDDDAYRPGFFPMLAASIAANQGSWIFYTNYEVREEGDVPKVSMVSLAPLDIEQIWVKNHIPNNCVVYHRRVATSIAYEKDIAYEDWDYLLSALERAIPTYLPIDGPVIYKKSEAGNASRGESSKENLLGCYVKVYSKHPSRNRVSQECRKALFQSIGLKFDDYFTEELMERHR